MNKLLKITLIGMFILFSYSYKNIKDENLKNTWIKTKAFAGKINGVPTLRAVGFSEAIKGIVIKNKNGKKIKTIEYDKEMTLDQSDSEARVILSMMFDQVIKEYSIKKSYKDSKKNTIEVKEIRSRSKFSGAKVVKHYKSNKGIYTMLEIKLTPKQLKEHKIDDVNLFLKIAKKRAKNYQ